MPRSIAAVAATAWVWSGVEMVTASIPFSLSSMTRKSLYCFALGNFSKVLAACFQSVSQRATMFSLPQPSMSVAPFPPAPIAAILSFSLRDLYPERLIVVFRAKVLLAASKAALLIRNDRRDNVFFIHVSSRSGDHFKLNSGSVYLRSKAGQAELTKAWRSV